MKTFRGNIYCLTERDIDLLVSLSHKVRLLTLPQIAETWWPRAKEPEKAARPSLRKLSTLDLLGSSHVLARPFLKLEEPAHSWSPGDPEPNFEPVAIYLRERWRDLPYRSVEVFYATQAAVNEYGGYMSGRLDHPNEATHDLHHAELFLRLKRNHPVLADGWISEMQLVKKAQPFEVLPDAVLHAPDGQPKLILEFAGVYDVERLKRLHTYAAERALPYEFW